MSRAFVKEDVEIAERRACQRPASGLPAGALNYLTADGAVQLRVRLSQLKQAPENHDAEISQIEHTLASATIVEPQVRSESVVFGATVTRRDATGELETIRIVGVDEVHLKPGNVSWVSAVGKALLGATIGQRVAMDAKAVRTVVKIE